MFKTLSYFLVLKCVGGSSASGNMIAVCTAIHTATFLGAYCGAGVEFEFSSDLVAPTRAKTFLGDESSAPATVSSAL
jgi:hypothetical protein